MAVVEIRQVGMIVLEGRVFVAVGVGFTERIPGEVNVPMMLVVHVAVVVFQGFVCV